MQGDRRPLIFASVIILMTLYIIFSGPIFIGNIPFLFMQIFGLLMIGWAVLAKKMQHKKITLPKGYFFVTQGPYEIVRHPIWVGFLLIMCAFVQGYSSILRLFAFIILLVAVLLKILYVENVMEKEIPEYKEYKKKTHRIIPYFW